jgi:hypothetical protein
MEILDWQSDGVFAMIALVLYGVILAGFVTRGAIRNGSIARLIPGAIAWHLAIFAFLAFWLLPHYSATSHADAIEYYADGIRNAEFIRSGNWHEISISLGTDIIPLVTGLLFAPAGANIYGILFFSSVLGFCGSLYFCRAFSLWATPSQLKSYAAIMLFLPSFVTWTSIFGKDSWVCLGLGLAAYGYSVLLKARTRRGLWSLLIGIGITTAIRPHISLTLVASMALAYLWGLTRSTRGSIVTKAGTILLLGSMVAGLIAVASSFIGVADFSIDTVGEYAIRRSARSAGAGNSSVEVRIAPGIGGVLRAFPRGIIRVLFQPFPWQIDGFNSGLAGAENIFLLFYILFNARRLRTLVRGVWKEPYLLFSFAILMLLLLMLSLISNLGLISRERAQALPFLFALIAGAKAARRRPDEMMFGGTLTFEHRSSIAQRRSTYNSASERFRA